MHVAYYRGVCSHGDHKELSYVVTYIVLVLCWANHALLQYKYSPHFGQTVQPLHMQIFLHTIAISVRAYAYIYIPVPVLLLAPAPRSTSVTYIVYEMMTITHAELKHTSYAHSLVPRLSPRECTLHIWPLHLLHGGSRFNSLTHALEEGEPGDKAVRVHIYYPKKLPTSTD